MIVMAGDIGGTKCNFGLFDPDKTHNKPIFKETYQSSNFDSLTDAVKWFLNSSRESGITDSPETAAFGVAGPVINGNCTTPNLPWTISVSDLSDLLGINRVMLLNDLEANAWGILQLHDHQLHNLNQGISMVNDNKAIIAAGTGLGEAFILNDSGSMMPFASEGGHADFAPADQQQLGFCEWLMNKFGHASYERVLSGPGLVNIYTWLKQTDNESEPEWLTQAMQEGDKAAAISQGAMLHKSAVCVRALDLFVSIYGSEAGNLALKYKALGGIYLGGGIAPKILSWLKKEIFMNAFCDKGRFRSLLEEIRVDVILEPETALFGAANRAFSLGS